MNKPVLPMSSLSLQLPTADRRIESYRLRGIADVSGQTSGHAEPRRVFRGACGG